MTLGGKLKELRDAKNLKQREIGNVIGLDGSFICQVELDKKPLNRKHLSKLANFCDIDDNVLELLWLADKIYRMIEKEQFAKASVSNVLDRL